MGLQTSHLEAFSEVAKLRSFSKAAKVLHVTQSALSQRVMNLESEIGHALFIRDPAGIRLTDEGQELLRYCRSKDYSGPQFSDSLLS
jgi:DNA-binding transcriptional LysR family regulator